jgi:hypothetical protein
VAVAETNEPAFRFQVTRQLGVVDAKRGLPRGSQLGLERFGLRARGDRRAREVRLAPSTFDLE